MRDSVMIKAVASKLYLIDGMSHIYRAYHAIRSLSNKKGLPTNAVFGFTNMLRKLVQEEKPDYLGVAIDLPGPTLRHEQYKDYKATRKPMPDDLKQQLPFILKVCKALRVPVLSCERYEADDVIGTLAQKAEKKGLEVVIVTIDKDMCQLVSDRVTILDTRSMNRLDSSKVEDKFGVPPERIVDFLSLVGDASDNIPGAQGIGAKGARQLIQKYGSLEQIFYRRDQVKRTTYRKSLQQNEDLIRQSQKLLTIQCDLSLEPDLDDLKMSDPDQEAVKKLFSELDFTGLIEGFLPIHKISRDHCKQIESLEELGALAKRIKGKQVGLALLCSGKIASRETLKAVAVAEEERQIFCIPCKFLENWGSEFAEVLKSAKEWVIHDLKLLHLLARQYHWSLGSNFKDTMLMAYLLRPDQNDFSLSRLSIEYLGQKLSDFEDESEHLLGEGLMEHSCERAQVTLSLAKSLSSRIEKTSLADLLVNIEIPLVQVLARMEAHGVKVDIDFLAEMSNEITSEIEHLIREIYKISGEEFKINSPRQLSTILFEKLCLPAPKKTRKAGHYATGVEVLDKLAGEHRIAKAILSYRELTKLKNTYLDALPKLVNASTGRIHTSYNQVVTSTGRLSSSNPNLQNIPIKSNLGRKIRYAFVPEPGYQILSADYSQIELRVMAHLSQDPVLIDSFLRGEDVHERTALEVFGSQARLYPYEYRRRAKFINFGIIYGLSAFGLAQNLKIGRHEAQEFIDCYFEKYQGIKVWIDQTLADAQEKGYVKTLFGRIRPVPEILSKNWNVRNFAERTAINAPIQGTAADLIKKAMVDLDRDFSQKNLKSKLILQVHDELVIEVQDAEVDDLKILVKNCMESVTKLSVPLPVDLAIGLSWFDAK